MTAPNKAAFMSASRDVYPAVADPNPWVPMTNLQDLKTMGKLGEEVSELSAAVCRCIIQGVNEVHPATNYQNRCWLEDEIADVEANIKLVKERFKLDTERINKRAKSKESFLRAWHAMLGD